MSDTLILSNAALAIEPAAVELPAQGWAQLAPGIYWQGQADGYAAAASIHIVGVAGSSACKAHFLLLP